MRALFIGGALAASVFTYATADGADLGNTALGGSCCADLEERVAELEATTVRKGNRKVGLELYGTVHAAVFLHDYPGEDRAPESVINPTQDRTRFGLRGSAKINADWSAGFTVEVNLGGYDPVTGASNADAELRRTVVRVTSKTFGEFALGYTSTATDFITELDLSRSKVASRPLSLRPAGFALNGLAFDPFDGRREPIARWKSPTIAGFQVSAAAEDQDEFDVALRSVNEYGGWLRVAAGVGYRMDDGPLDSQPDVETFAGSVSIMAVPLGVFVNFSGSLQDLPSGPYIEAGAVRVGVETPLFFAGAPTTLFGEAAAIESPITGDFATVYGGGIVQHVPSAAMDLYVDYKRINDEGLVGFGQRDVVLIGSRIQF